MKRRSASATRSSASTADISAQTQRIFENAGSDVDPIRVRSDSEASELIEKLAQKIAEGVDWDDQVKAMRKGMGLVKGGALEFESFQRGLIMLNPGLSAAATNLRSALVKTACLFISQLAINLSSSITICGDFIAPLSSQLTHGTQIIAESCKFSILVIAKNCPNRRVMKSIFDICSARAAQVKIVASESLAYMIHSWPHEIMNPNYPKIETIIQKLLSDASVDVRLNAKRASKEYSIRSPSNGVQFIQRLDPKLQRAIREVDPLSTSTVKPTITTNFESTQPTRDTSFKSSTMKSSAQRRRPSPKWSDTTPNPEAADISANPPRIIRQTKPVSSMQQHREEFQEKRKYVPPPPEQEEERPVIVSRKSRASRAHQQPEPKFEQRNEMTYNPKRPVYNDEPDDRIRKVKYNERKKIEPVPQDESDEFDEEPQKEIVLPRRTRMPANEPIVDEVRRNPTPAREETRFGQTSSFKAPKRQSSVQPKRSLDYLSSPKGYHSPTKRLRDLEEKHPIKLENGYEQEFLDTLKNYIKSNHVSELASSMQNIPSDLITCVSNFSHLISSNAISLIHQLIPPFSPYFMTNLPLLIETLLKQVEYGNPRSASNSLQVLNEMPNSFDCNNLLSICLTQQPSEPLLNFTALLVSLDDIDVTSDAICQKLIMLAFRSHNIGDGRNKRTAAQIIQKVNDVNSGAVSRFADSLRDQQLRLFEQFIHPFIPELSFRTLTAEVPCFNPTSPVIWRKKIDQLVQDTSDDNEWNEIRPKVFAELNEALNGQTDVESVLRLTKQILSTRGCDDFNRLMSGLMRSSKNYSNLVSDVLDIITQNADPAEVFSALQPQILSTDVDVCKASIALETKLIIKFSTEDVRQSVSQMISALTKSFESTLPVVRKSVVLCFVELYVKLGKDVMDRHTSHLSRGQQKLIVIYYDKRCQ